MKKILVTGASGFIGSALVDSLETLGFDAIRFDSVNGDISECDFVKEYKNEEIEHVFHLAAKTFVPDS